MLHGWEEIGDREKEVIARGVADGNVYGGPFHVELSPTDNCNYDCFFCNQGFIDRKKSLPLEKLTELIDQLVDTGLKTVRLSGGGEPFLHPQIKEFLEHLHKHSLKIHNVTTNGYMLTAPVVERLMALPTKEIIVSLNEVDPDRYGEMMKVRPKSFHRVVKLLMAAYMPVLKEALGIFLPLIVVNCIILGRAEAFASKNAPLASMVDGLGMGLGFTLALSLIGIVREVLGSWQLLGIPVADGLEPYALSVFIIAPGGFLTLGLLLALFNHLANCKAEKAKLAEKAAKAKPAEPAAPATPAPAAE